MSVIDVVMISSPGSGSMAATATWIAAVPDVQAQACFAPQSDAKRSSKLRVKLPLVGVSVPLWIASARFAISSAPSVRPLASWSEGSSSGLCFAGMVIVADIGYSLARNGGARSA